MIVGSCPCFDYTRGGGNSLTSKAFQMRDGSINSNKRMRISPLGGNRIFLRNEKCWNLFSWFWCFVSLVEFEDLLLKTIFVNYRQFNFVLGMSRNKLILTFYCTVFEPATLHNSSFRLWETDSFGGSASRHIRNFGLRSN